ncbi:hypothetical protein ACFX2J_027137 [Malus domestica]
MSESERRGPCDTLAKPKRPSPESTVSTADWHTCPIPLFPKDNHHPHTILARRFSTEAEYPPQDSPPSDHSLELSPSDQKQDASPIDPSLRTPIAG